jgi:3-dehydroquinate synthase
VIRIDGAGYPVWLGDAIAEEALGRLPEGRFFLVTDANVAAAGWPERIADALGGRLLGIEDIPPGEASKDFSTLEALLDTMLEARVERGDFVVAVGGGMIGDLAGLAAALLKRGCGFVQVPTSLLAQADAAIGGKTAINTRHGKNLLGAFHPPAAVIVDVAMLATLPSAELRSGYAEVVKYGLIGDAEFFAWCEEHGPAVIAGDPQARLHAVETSVRAKIRLVAGDERDLSGQRALLNFGHTFGHAIEAETGMRHGEAVAMGMALAFRLSAQRGLCPAPDAARVAAHLEAVGLPTRLDRVDPKRLAERIAHDKKRSGDRLRLVLARRVGEAFLDDSVTAGEIEAFLERELESAGLAVT